MNKVYKVVWNATLGTWLAVSELAKGRSKSSSNRKHKLFVGLTVIGVIFTSSQTFAAVTLGAGSSGVRDVDVAIGLNTKADGSASLTPGSHAATAVGSNAQANYSGSTAMGSGALANSQAATALGSRSIASGNYSTAVGWRTSATGLASVAVGDGSISSNNYSIAIGSGSNASKADSIALGSGSTTTTNAVTVNNATVGGLTYTGFSGSVSSTGKQVSLGSVGTERQIKNMAAGVISSTSTDAINGSQLYATNAVLGNVANSAKTVLGGNAALNANGTLSITNIGGTGKNNINDAIAASKTIVTAGTNVTNVVRTSNANGQDIYTVNAKGSTASAGSSAVTVTAGTPLNNVTNYAVDLSQTTKDSLVKADTALQSVVTQIDGVDVKTVNKNDNKVNFVTGDNVELTANADGSIKVGTAADVTFNTVNTTNLTATGDTKLGDSFTVNKGGSYYSGPITEGDHITNKTYVDGKVSAVADTPITFAANTGSVAKKLGETVTIKGTGAKADTEYSSDNIKTIVDADGNLVVALDKNLAADSVTLNGQNGKDGISLTGAAGQPGVNGTDGITRIIYTDPTTGEPQQVATLNDGLKFGGNTGDVIAKKLNEQLDITGELADTAESTGANLRVDSKDGKLNLVMAKDLTDLTSVTVGDTIINGDSITTTNLTATGDTKLGDSFTVNKGGSYYSGPITEGDHITNKTYVDGKVSAVADTPITFAANTGSVAKKLGETVTIKGTGAKADTEYSSDNIKTIVDADGNLVVALDKNLAADSVTLNGQNGKDGISLTGAAGQPGVNGTDGITRIIYTDPTTGEPQQVATLNDGLKFGGNTGDVIAKKLNEQLDITGELADTAESTGANLRVDSKDGKLNLVMAKDLTDLTSVTVGDTIINGDSITTTNLTATGDTKLGDSFTVNKGGSYYSGPITEGDHITNKTYVDGKVSAVADTPITFAANTGSVAKKLGETVTIKGTGAKADTEYSSDNIKTIVDADGNLVVALDKNLAADSVTLNGQNGKDGISLTGAAGQPGVNGTDGITRIIYTDPTTGEPQQVATLNDGLKFGGNTGDVIAKKLNEQLDITGELADTAESTGANLRVDSKDGKLNLVMAKDLTDLTSVTVGDTIINGDSITTTNLTATGDTKLGDSFTVNKGGSYYSGPITEGDHITNKTYVDGKVSAVADTPITFAANTGSVAKKLGETVTIKGTGAKADTEYSSDNIKTIVDADGNLVVALDKNLAADSVTLNGQNGKDGISLTGAAGQPGVNGTDGITRIIYTDPTTGEPQQVATLNDGLKFGGNTGDVIAKKLNEQLDITGELADTAESTGANLRVDSKDGKLNLVMAKDLTDLTSVTVGDTIINGDSITTTNLTATGDTKLGDSFTVNKGGSYYSGPITEGDHITNKTYVDGKVSAVADTPITFAANTGSVAKKLGETVTIKGTGAKADTEYSSDNIKTIVDADGNLVVALDKNLAADSVTLNGQNGKDGISLTGAAGQPGVNGTDGITRIIYTDPTTGEPQQVATLNDGLKFGGNTGDVIAKKLNEQLDITGELADTAESTGANLRVDSKDGKLNLVMAKDLTDLTSVTVGDTIINGDSITTTNLTATGDTKLGDSFTVNKGGSYYSGPITEGDHITNKTYVDQTAAASRTEVEQGKNIQVSSTTGVDGQTIYTVATADDVDFNKVTVGDTTITSNGLVIANGPSITKNGISAGDQKINDVADGEIATDSKDAVNGSQLYGLASNVTQLFGGNALYVNNQISWSNIGGTGQNNIDDAIKYVNDQAANANQGWKVTTDSGSNATSTVKPSDTVNINGDKASGVTVTNTGNNITVGLSDQIKVGTGNNAVSIDGSAGTIQVGDVQIDGSKGTITAGQVTVNGEAGTVNGLSNTTWDPNNIVSGQAATEDQLKQVAQNATQAATAAKSTVTAGDNITVSSSKNADGSTNYQVATQKDVTFDTVKSGSVTSDKVTVGNVVIDQAGINAGGNKVTNVANGTVSSTSTDAVNGSQLHASNTNIYNYLGGGANYETNTGPTYNVGGGSYNNVGDALNSLDQSVTNVSNRLEQAFYTTNKRIDDVENRANAGNAQALATAGLPQAYIPGKSMMAISGGTFRGESGYAIGMSSISDNGRWVFKISGSGNSRGDFGGTVGTGIQW